MEPTKSTRPKFKNRNERNSNFESSASILFKNKKLLNERPEGMNFEEYVILRRIQKRVLRQLFSGRCPKRSLIGIMGNSSNFGSIRRTKTKKQSVKQRLQQRKAS